MFSSHRRPYKSLVNYDPKRGISLELLTATSMDNEEPNAGVTLSFENINYELNVENNIWPAFNFCKLGRKKKILSRVSGKFQPGMNALLGPTGCGKSTLLDILADRKRRETYGGQVLINGQPRPVSSVYRYMVGYVVQDDMYSGTLTVRENIVFSANLRLSQSMSYEERLEKVDRIIRQLGLGKCAETRMGTESQRGVSGGERKRTCIAMEMVLSLRILFLDEPTTGLDASTACNVMKCLSDLARTGCTIVFSIHQPRHSIFELFDTVQLMLNGRTVYFGSSAEMVPYFTRLEHICADRENPADFALDLLNSTTDIVALDNLYEAHLRSVKNNSDLDTPLNDSATADVFIVQPLSRSFAPDFFYVSQRTLRTAVRNSALLAWQVAVSVILGVLTGLLYYKIPLTVGSGVQNRLGCIFFIVVNQIFSTATALEPFIKERSLFIHENTSGYYSISNLFLAKLACDLVPLRVVLSLVFSIICYSMTGLQKTASKFIVFVLTIFMANVFGSAMCFAIAATIPVFAVALIVLVLVFVIMMVFSGFLVELSSVFSFLRWIQWVSAFRYASNVLYINEFRNLQFCISNQTNVCSLSGCDVLAKRSIDHTSNWHLWKYFFALTLMAILSFVIAYVKLLLIKKKK